jgi:hypothetical protein
MTALLLLVLAFALPRGSAWLLVRSRERGPLQTQWTRPATAWRRAGGALAPVRRAEWPSWRRAAAGPGGGGDDDDDEEDEGAAQRPPPMLPGFEPDDASDDDALAGAGGEGEDPRLRVAVDRVAQQVRARLAEKQQSQQSSPSEGGGDHAAALASSSASGGGGGVDEVVGASHVAGGGIQTALNERFQLVYTCCACDTRNLITVNRISWNSGIVIATCRGCERSERRRRRRRRRFSDSRPHAQDPIPASSTATLAE